MMNRRIFFVWACLVMALIMTGCSFGADKDTASEPTAVSAATEAATEAPTDEPTAEPTEEITAEPTAEPTEEPTEEPTAEPTEEPTEEPTAEPTEAPFIEENAPEATAAPAGSVVFNTTYFAVEFPAEFAPYVVHAAENNSGVIEDVFNLKAGDATAELFRLVYGNPAKGTLLGYVQTNSGLIPVSYMAVSYFEDDLKAMGIEDLYYVLMEQMNPVLEGIMGDERFVADVSEASEAGLTELAYWSVSLPQSMEWEQTEVGGEYRVDFYGKIAESRVLLYTIYVGGEASETRSVIGVLTVDGEEKAVLIESYPFEVLDTWTEADIVAAGEMMDTVNANISAITALPEFSDAR